MTNHKCNKFLTINVTMRLNMDATNCNHKCNKPHTNNSEILSIGYLNCFTKIVFEHFLYFHTIIDTVLNQPIYLFNGILRK